MKCLIWNILRKITGIRIRCIHLFALLFLSLGLSFALSSESEAISFSDGGDTYVSNCSVIAGANTTYSGTKQVSTDDCVISQGASSGSQITINQLDLTLVKDISPNELINFSISFYQLGNPATTTQILNPEFYGIVFENDNGFLILDQECNDSSLYNGNMTTPTDEVVTCSFTGLVTRQLSRLKTIRSRIITYKSTNDYIWNIFFSPISTRRINYNGLTSDDRSWLQSNINDDDIIDKLDEILQAIPAGASQADIEEAVSNSIEAQREQERLEANAEVSGYDTAMRNNEDLDSISSSTTNIINIISQFVTIISRPVVSTCILPIHLEDFHGFGFYEVDLCHLSPPIGITNVLSVIYLFFILALAISGVRTIISLYKEITSF